MQHFLESKKARVIIFTLGAFSAMLLIFAGGVAVGYRKAVFSSALGQNYERNFYGPMPGAMGIMAPRGPNTHGVMGQVIDVTSSSFSVKDPDDDERFIIVTSGTVIRDMDQTISVDAMTPGNRVVVIGAPNSNGQVEARFVRVFPQ